jgi:hypothetical protein
MRRMSIFDPTILGPLAGLLNGDNDNIATNSGATGKKSAYNGHAHLKTYELNSSDNLFSGVWNLNQENLTKYDPFITGYAFIVWTKLPVFMERDRTTSLFGAGSNLTVAESFKILTEKNFKSLSGVGDITLGVEDITHGFAGNAYGVATGISKENTSFSLTHQELSGSPMRKVYDYWVSGIRDYETGLATYHGQINGDLKYIVKNLTEEIERRS